MAARQVVITVNAQVQWVYNHDSKSNRWIAVCPPLALTIEADTHTELRENIADAMNLLMRSMLSSGELRNFLHDRGWSTAHQQIEKIKKGDKDVFFDVPIELIAKHANDKQRALH